MMMVLSFFFALTSKLSESPRLYIGYVKVFNDNDTYTLKGVALVLE